eukprot:g73027.t1
MVPVTNRSNPFLYFRWARPVKAFDSLASSHPVVTMTVSQEDGGRLNAFAKEPRMSYAEEPSVEKKNTNYALIGGGAVVVLGMLAITANLGGSLLTKEKGPSLCGSCRGEKVKKPTESRHECLSWQFKVRERISQQCSYCGSPRSPYLLRTRVPQFQYNWQVFRKA